MPPWMVLILLAIEGGLCLTVGFIAGAATVIVTAAKGWVKNV